MLISTIAASTILSASFAPENNLHLEDDQSFYRTEGLTYGQFEEVLDAVDRYYGPIIRHYGVYLNVNKDWNDSTVNAYAWQTGTDWHINMFGGLARRSEVTVDGFAAVACHEIGHHLGGYPFYYNEWAAAEGQSDYFATAACLKAVLVHIPPTEEPSAKALKVCGGDTYCARIADAGQSTANLLHRIGGGGLPPDILKPDTFKTNKLMTSYPKTTQCRLDTYVAGAKCDKTWDHTVIPGKNYDSGIGINDKAGYAASLVNNCNNRPRCWFIAP